MCCYELKQLLERRSIAYKFPNFRSIFIHFLHNRCAGLMKAPLFSISPLEIILVQINFQLFTTERLKQTRLWVQIFAPLGC